MFTKKGSVKAHLPELITCWPGLEQGIAPGAGQQRRKRLFADRNTIRQWHRDGLPRVEVQSPFAQADPVATRDDEVIELLDAEQRPARDDLARHGDVFT